MSGVSFEWYHGKLELDLEQAFDLVGHQFSLKEGKVRSEWFKQNGSSIQGLQAIYSRWHQPKVDLFATRFNNKLHLGLTSSRSTSLDSKCPQSTLGGSGPICLPTSSHLGQIVDKLQVHPCNRLILIAPGWFNMPWFWDLVTMSSQIPLCLHFLPDLGLSYSTRLFTGTW